jgi:hypothetical protein
VQRATAQSKTGFFRDYGVAEVPPGFQADWSDCMYFFSLFLFISLLIWVFRVSFCTHEQQEREKIKIKHTATQAGLKIGRTLIKP